MNMAKKKEKPKDAIGRAKRGEVYRGIKYTISQKDVKEAEALARVGASITRIAALWGMSYQALSQIRRENIEIAEMIDYFQTLSLGYWEELGEKGTTMSQKVNSNLYTFLLSRRYRDQYGDKIETTNTHTVDGRHDINISFNEIKSESSEDVE